MSGQTRSGACLCGAVRFTVAGDLAPPDACHCSQCRKQSGHYWASTDVPEERLEIEGAQNISWYQSSEKIRRGFCKICGSILFWDPVHRPWTAIAMGAFDPPTGTRLHKHIFTAEKGDYYDIGDDVVQE
ncbi:MAG: GFA family protein [Sphingomonadales bacterium]|nr:GFA family protein [Sphingomonadales bacterium]